MENLDFEIENEGKVLSYSDKARELHERFLGGYSINDFDSCDDFINCMHDLFFNCGYELKFSDGEKITDSWLKSYYEEKN